MVQITWLGHSTFQLRLDSGEVYVLDPWIDNPKYPAGHKFARVDAVLVTHGHFDHIAGVTQLAREFGAKVAGIYEVCSYLKSKGVETTLPMNIGGTQAIGPLRVTMTPARHSSGIEDEKGNIIYGGESAGYVLHFPDGRAAYFAGDTSVFSDMQLIEQLYRPELAVLPIGDLFTMDPLQAALACRLLKPKKVLPMHYGTFPPLTGRPEHLVELLKDLPGTEVWTLEPGQPVEW